MGGGEAAAAQNVGGAPSPSSAPTRWFYDPEAFRPERWLDGLEKRLPKFAYIPFGGGPRICIGNSFALMETRLVAATIARRFRLAVAPGQRIATLPQITLQPRYGLRMVVG